MKQSCVRRLINIAYESSRESRHWTSWLIACIAVCATAGTAIVSGSSHPTCDRIVVSRLEANLLRWDASSWGWQHKCALRTDEMSIDQTGCVVASVPICVIEDDAPTEWLRGLPSGPRFVRRGTSAVGVPFPFLSADWQWTPGQGMWMRWGMSYADTAPYGVLCGYRVIPWRIDTLALLASYCVHMVFVCIARAMSFRAIVWYRLRSGLCPSCGYCVRGLQSSRCPECGQDVPRSVPSLGRGRKFRGCLGERTRRRARRGG